MNSLSVFGASGHAKVVLEIIELNGIQIDQIYDEDPSKDKIMNFPINHNLAKINSNTFVAIGNNIIRKTIVEKYSLTGPYIKHPSVNLSKHSQVGEGTVLMAGVSINPDCRIGIHCILNTNCSVDHDCIVEDYVHISPNVSLAGNVKIGEGTHVGIGATIIQGLNVGRNCIIGAGAVIINDIPDNSVVVGNPGRVIKKLNSKKENKQEDER
ncbi:acetyltransferase EpsM [Sphingobacterium alimentarium]|uniref:Acetyltransferase EpsM n=1 Tax=Sphingobacterium alimentarium TaxID=797292 RepID=A0A4R3VWI3_9SPHI|nr:acetyltransferase [Sphingobacterium alimentarium]TCV10504.1 acetyltransferase EpsM [Sphingobacterium alimentarium]